MKFSLKKLFLVSALLAILISVFAVSALAAEAKLGSVTANSLRFRSQPSLNGSEIGKIAYGTTVLIVDTVENGEWYKVVHNFDTGYVSAEYVTILDDADVQLGDGLSTASNVNVRKSPSLSGAKITQLSKGQRVTVIGVSQGWYKVLLDGTVGYVNADYLEVVTPVTVSRSPTGNEPVNDSLESEIVDGDENAPDIIDEPNAATATGITAEMITYAKKFLGCKYVYGANGPKTFDCSGFTSYVYKNFGYSLNRSAAGQMSNGRSVKKGDLIPGDLVFFRDPKGSKSTASHVGMYIGNDQFIHASSTRKGVVISALGENYYTKNYIGARRIL